MSSSLCWSGGDESDSSARDIEYVRDLGLIARDGPLRIANPIYAEVEPRELTWAAQELLVQDTAWYVGADGGLDVEKLLGAFQDFFREHSEHWLGRFDYAEAGPQLLLQALLQRVVNSGGRIEREYGLGRGRTDLLIVWPRGGEEAPPGAAVSRSVVECKILHKSLERTIADGLSRRSPTWTAAPAKPAIWSSLTAARGRPGARRSSAAKNAKTVGPSRCGGCDCRRGCAWRWEDSALRGRRCRHRFHYSRAPIVT